MTTPATALFGNVPTSQGGPCVFGQGYCGPTVNNVVQTFNQNLTEKLSSSTIIKNTSAAAVMTSTQNIDLSGLEFDGCQSVNISNITNKAVIKYDFNMMAKNITQSQFQNVLKNAVDAAIKSDTRATTEALSGGAQSVTNNVTQNYNNTINRLVNSFSYSDFTKLMANMSNQQTISLKGFRAANIPGACNISNLSNDASLTIVMSIISETVSEEFTKIIQENTAKTAVATTTTTSAQGVIGDTGRAVSGVISATGDAVGSVAQSALMGLMLPLLFIFVVIIMLAMMYKAVSTASGDQSAPADVPRQN